jgi:hypothetical protein
LPTLSTLAGSVVKERSAWRLSVLPDAFWGVLNLIAAFFSTLFSVRRS